MPLPVIPAVGTGLPAGNSLASIIGQIVQRQQGAPMRAAQLAHEQAATTELQRMLGPRADLARAQAAKAQHEATGLDYKNPIALMQKGQELFKANPNDPRLRVIGSMINKLSAQKAGISIGTGPQGGMQVQIGGQTGGQAQAGGQNVDSPFGSPIVNPMTKAGRGAKGATYVDQNTGKIYSTPSGQETTQLQKSVMGDKQLKNIADTLVSRVKTSGFLNPSTHAAALAATWIPGLKSMVPQFGEAKSGILGVHNAATQAIDAMMRTTASPKIREALKMNKDMFMPHMGETPEGYKKRVYSNLASITKNAKIGEESLKKGISLGKAPELPYKSVQVAPKSFSDYVYPRYEHVKNPNYQEKSAVTASKYSDEDLAFTAKKHGMTIEALKKRLGE